MVPKQKKKNTKNSTSHWKHWRLRVKLDVHTPPRNGRQKIKVPLSLLVDIESSLYTRVNVFHPDWPIRSNFWLRRSDNLVKDSHQNSWTRVKRGTGGFTSGGIARAQENMYLSRYVSKDQTLQKRSTGSW